jgi:hypothetical protein
MTKDEFCEIQRYVDSLSGIHDPLWEAGTPGMVKSLFIELCMTKDDRDKILKSNDDLAEAYHQMSDRLREISKKDDEYDIKFRRMAGTAANKLAESDRLTAKIAHLQKLCIRATVEGWDETRVKEELDK